MEESLKIEVLFPEFCNLYGDISNMKYLKRCLPKAQFFETQFGEVPHFVNENVNLIYLGSMTEQMQEKVIRKLQPYKNRIKELIDNNAIFLITGNAIEVFGNYIENEDGSKIEALKIFDIYAKRDMLHRHNSTFIGKWNNIDVVGFKSTFTFAYGNNENNYFAKVEKGIGLNKDSNLEGIEKNNFIATYLIGPILILNPTFTKKIIEKLKVSNTKLAFEQDLINAYNQRIQEFRRI